MTRNVAWFSVGFMFPIKDHNPSQSTPYVTYVLMGLNLLVFLSYWQLSSDPRALGQFYQNWALIPARVTSGTGWHTFISSIFLHGGWVHLAGNLLFLWIFGDNMEDELGPVNFLALYLTCGFLAGVAQVAADPNSPIPTVGASGAIAGIMGGYLLLFPRARVDVLFIFIIIFKVFPIPAWAVLGIWFGIQVFSGVGADLGNGGVAYWAHIGGFLAGLLLALPHWLRQGGVDFWRQTHGHPPHPEAKYKLVRSRVPSIRRKP